MLPALNNYRLSMLRLQLDDVLDFRVPESLGISVDDLRLDTDHELTREIGRAAFDAGAEGILIPSATRLGDNLIVYPENLRETSQLDITGHRHPRLYVERESEE